MSVFVLVFYKTRVCLVVFWLCMPIMMENMHGISLHISIQSTGITLTKMPAILKLRSYLKRLHILIVSCLTQKREGSMTVLDLRFLSFPNEIKPCFLIFFCFFPKLFLQHENKNMACDIGQILSYLAGQSSKQIKNVFSLVSCIFFFWGA